MAEAAERYWIIDHQFPTGSPREVSADKAVAFVEVCLELGYTRTIINGGVRLTPAFGEGTLDVIDTRSTDPAWRHS